MPIVDLEKLIFYIDISTIKNTDIFRWAGPVGVMFPVDILSARTDALADVFRHHENKNRRMVFIKKPPYTYIIGADNTVQFQVLEAIIESVIAKFNQNYGQLPVDLLIHGMANAFAEWIPKIFTEVHQTGIKWIQTKCIGCHEDHQIAVKKSLIDNAKSYPISLVFVHRGHGLLLYLDKNFQIRGAEIVDMTG